LDLSLAETTVIDAEGLSRKFHQQHRCQKPNWEIIGEIPIAVSANIEPKTPAVSVHQLTEPSGWGVEKKALELEYLRILRDQGRLKAKKPDNLSRAASSIIGNATRSQVF